MEKKISVLEASFQHEGLDCAVVFTKMGHRCGYVGVKKTSPLFKVNYSDNLKKPELLEELKQTTFGKRGVMELFCWDGERTSPSILFDVHGSITYSDGLGCWPVTRGYPLWWFGFDCAHYGDAKDWNTVAKYWGEGEEIQKMYDIDMEFYTGGIIRTKEYVIQECKNLAEQILCVESTY